MDPQSLTHSSWSPLAPKLRPLLVSPHFELELQFDGSASTIGKPLLTIECMECMRIGEGVASFFDDCGVYNATRCNGSHQLRREEERPIPGAEPCGCLWVEVGLHGKTRLVGFHTRPREHAYPCVYYFEITVLRRVGLIGVGLGERAVLEFLDTENPLAQDVDLLEYLSGGYIAWSGKDVMKVPSIHADDTIGCGIVFGSLIDSFIFTRNGKLVSTTHRSHAGVRPTMIPLVTVRPGHRGKVVFRANFGQDPFHFDTGASYRPQRPTDMARSLPPELLEIIFHHTLSQIVYKDLLYPTNLALVCSRWNTLCFPHLSRNLHLRSVTQLSTISPKLLTAIESLAMSESVDSGLWFHRVALSSNLERMVSLSSMTRNFQVPKSGERLYNPPLPPTLASLLPSLLRRGLSFVHSLSMSNYTFKSWLEFAKLVVCLPSLSDLDLFAVTWTKDDTESPPPWLRSHARLTKIKTNAPSTLSGLARLFLIRRHPRNAPNATSLNLDDSDSAPLANIIRNLQGFAAVPLYDHSVTLEYFDSGQCVLGFRTEGQDCVVRLEFGRSSPNGPHRLRHLYVSLAGKIRLAHRRSLANVSAMLRTLSGGEVCRCVFDVQADAGWSYDDPIVVQVLCENFNVQRGMGMLEIMYGGKRRILDTHAPLVLRSLGVTTTTAGFRRAKDVFSNARGAFLTGTTRILEA